MFLSCLNHSPAFRTYYLYSPYSRITICLIGLNKVLPRSPKIRAHWEPYPSAHVNLLHLTCTIVLYCCETAHLGVFSSSDWMDLCPGASMYTIWLPEVIKITEVFGLPTKQKGDDKKRSAKKFKGLMLEYVFLRLITFNGDRHYSISVMLDPRHRVGPDNPVKALILAVWIYGGILFQSFSIEIPNFWAQFSFHHQSNTLLPLHLNSAAGSHLIACGPFFLRGNRFFHRCSSILIYIADHEHANGKNASTFQKMKSMQPISFTYIPWWMLGNKVRLFSKRTLK